LSTSFSHTIRNTMEDEPKKYFDKTYRFSCSPMVKKVARAFIDHAHRAGIPFTDTVFRCIEDEDINIYWKGVHHECDIVEGDDEVVYLRVNIRTCDDQIWKSHIISLEGKIDEQIVHATSLFIEALKK
jgi:hypothetical protein